MVQALTQHLVDESESCSEPKAAVHCFPDTKIKLAFCLLSLAHGI